MDQVVTLPIGCPSYNLDLADVRAALEERVAPADLERHPVALRIDVQLALADVGAVAPGLHNIASTAVCAIGEEPCGSLAIGEQAARKEFQQLPWCQHTILK